MPHKCYQAVSYLSVGKGCLKCDSLSGCVVLLTCSIIVHLTALAFCCYETRMNQELHVDICLILLGGHPEPAECGKRR